MHTPGDPPRRNSYSLTSSPLRTDRYEIAVRLDRAGRGGSLAIHGVATEDVLEIELPQNLFAPDRTARRHLLVAGGIGITPFLSYAHELKRTEVAFELHWSVRPAGAEPALLDDLCELCPDELRRHDSRHELLAALDAALDAQPIGTHLSTCGPSAMMQAVCELARAHGWPDQRLHVERFALDSGPMDPFTVWLARSEQTIEVGEDLTLLEALERAGHELPYLCRQGICGECRTPVLEGEPDHRDDYLTAEERETGEAIMPCISRASGPLVLDL